MQEELAAIQEVVDLTPQDALISAQSLLSELGYRTSDRTETALSVQRPSEGDGARAYSLTVSAMPQPAGGVLITVRGDDKTGVEAHRKRWVWWANGLPKKAPEAPLPVVASPAPTEQATALQGTPYGPPEPNVIFDRRDQLEKIRSGLLPGEAIEAVFDLKGGGTGFIGITSKRLIFQDNAWVMNTKAIVSIPYSRIHTVAAEDSVGMLGGRGFFSSSKILITTSAGPRMFQFRGADKAHVAHDLILRHMI